MIVTRAGGEVSSCPVRAKVSYTCHRVRMSERRKININITVKHYRVFYTAFMMYIYSQSRDVTVKVFF